MIFEIDDENRDFATTYKKEYGPKRIKKLFKAKSFFREDTESNLITDAYKEHLNLQEINERLPPRKRTETLQDHLNKLRSERPHLKKFLPRDPPDEAVVVREQKKLLRSTYQLEFAKHFIDGNDPIEESIKIALPENCSIPETEQKKSFRDPRHFGTSNALKKIKLIIQPNNLDVNEKEREILRIRTGNSEYQDIIGKVGERIIKEQFFGPPIPIQPPEEHIKNPDSARSICSQILMDVSKYPALSQVF